MYDEGTAQPTEILHLKSITTQLRKKCMLSPWKKCGEFKVPKCINNPCSIIKHKLSIFTLLHHSGLADAESMYIKAMDFARMKLPKRIYFSGLE